MASQQVGYFEIFELKIEKLDTLKKISYFIVQKFYPVQKFFFKDCDDCCFIDRCTQIYILCYPNYSKEEEDGEVRINEFHKYFIKHFGTFYSLFVFMESINILHEQKHEKHNEIEKKKIFLTWNGGYNPTDFL